MRTLNDWDVACVIGKLAVSGPLSVKILGEKLAVWRSAAYRPFAEQCREIALSAGGASNPRNRIYEDSVIPSAAPLNSSLAQVTRPNPHPLRVDRYKTFHPNRESYPHKNGNFKSPQALRRVAGSGGDARAPVKRNCDVTIRALHEERRMIEARQLVIDRDPDCALPVAMIAASRSTCVSRRALSKRGGMLSRQG